MTKKKLLPTGSGIRCHSCNAGWNHDKLVAKWKVLRHEPYCEVASRNGAIVSAALRT